ncbi:lysophospholipid acyltransferase family protein [Paenibacillus sp. GCM10028914]|uniref:lysophospholipid acyltransferase family protein n=1 Tax=Paenibacillus sp. GCM10028914 TaxID=3273416 RepID=UPI00362003D1
MKIFRTIIWFFYFWLYLLMMIPGLRKANRLQKQGLIEEHDAYISKHVGRWARSLLKAAGAKVTVHGMENIPQNAAVFVSNHQGNFDVPIMLGHIGKPKALMAKVELSKLPIIRKWMKHLQCIFVDRNNVRQAINSLNEAAKLINNNYSVIVFPEGTRSKGEQLGEFKPGAFRIAAKTGAPIVPIRIQGSYKLMEENGFWISPAEVTVTILPPISTAGLSKTEIAALPEQVKDLIANV